jgi:hypothetical protein
MILNGIRKAVRIIAYQEKGNTVSAANAEKEKKVILYHIDNRKGEKENDKDRRQGTHE